eukprot:5250556-Pleurochrysis_carterae.AAC.1
MPPSQPKKKTLSRVDFRNMPAANAGRVQRRAAAVAIASSSYQRYALATARGQPGSVNLLSGGTYALSTTPDPELG